MKAIVAMDLNRVIGNNGFIPWHIPEDFKWFKKITMGGDLVMGNSTFKSVGSLPGRFTYVVTNNKEKIYGPSSSRFCYINGDFFITNKELIESDCEKSSRMWLCGGASVYRQFLPLCTEVYATIVIDEYEGDTFMPHFEDDFPNTEILREEPDFWIVRYWK